jgi:hypothetical protein
MQIGWDLYVFYSRSLSSFVIDGYVFAIAWGCHKGVDLYA